MKMLGSQARRASYLSWATFFTALLLLVGLVLATRAPDGAWETHHKAAAGWQDRHPQPPRAAWRDAPWAESLQRWDHAAFRTVNSGWRNPAFDRMMPVVTYLGDGGVQAVALFGFLLWAVFHRRAAYRHSALMGLIGLAAGAAIPLVKLVVPRFRPPTLYPHDVVLLTHPLYGGSFPSGHTFTSFCIATILTRCHPWIAPWAFGLAALVGLSRICVGVHWPLDVIGGAGLGIASGWLVTSVWARKHRAATDIFPVAVEDDDVFAQAALRRRG